MTTDEAFLNEVKSFLNMMEVILPHTPADQNGVKNREAAGADIPSARVFSSPVGVNHKGFEGGECGGKPDAHDVRLDMRKAKEAIRKKRYQRRIKDEREALRRMVSELSGQLREIKRYRSAVTPEDRTLSLHDSGWRDLALRQRDLRFQAEKEKMQLVDAVHIQASYIEDLCRLRLECDGNSTVGAIELGSQLSLQELCTIGR